ncbi:MAG TPA: amino acid adenylation domain-containing protein [Gemmataceae bacterium]|jgi:amino acid adenylation domain-containing protein|nr:amino acid adenylation domain-containing protein [Gemmataceae bacterium]
MAAHPENSPTFPDRPPTPIEAEVAAIWADVLELDVVRPEDDFFELGGDSLSAVQILTRITRRFNYKVTEVELFTARTVRGLCQVVEQAVLGTQASGAQLVPIDGLRVRFPATAAQRRLWILDHILPNPEVYNVGFLIRIQGQLELEPLRAAFERVEERHEAMRVHFETEHGLPVQVIAASKPFELPFVDLRDKPESERRTIATTESTACLSARIPLTAERLYRVKLYRTGSDEYLLWINMHHTITDGWSWGVFFKDMEAYYEAAKAGAAPRIRPLPIQYGDYATWEVGTRKTQAFRDQLEYWKKTLAPPVPTLDLPFARPRPVWQTFKGAMFKFDVPKKLVGAVDKLSRQESVTRFMVGLAAFQTVLGRYTGADNLLLGTPVANRNRGETEPLVGLFVNTVVLRTDISGDPTFRELLERVRQTRLGAFAHQDVSLESLIEELRPGRDTSRQAFFQAAFYYQNVNIIPERFARMKVSTLPVHNGTSMFDLRLVLEDGPFGGLWGWIEYNTDLFEESHIRQLVGHFLTVLEAAAANPTTPISKLPLLTPAERQRIVAEWNQTVADYPKADCLPDGFARRAADLPNAPALICNGKAISYRQLQERSNRLAHFLKGRGVKSGDLVGVCLKRSADMIAAVLAVTKIGAAYVPLDSSYPRDRLAFMLEDTNAAVLLTQSALLDRLPDVGDRLVNINEIEAELSKQSTSDLEKTHTADSIAYVIYTSGSTGKPKGVVVRHRAALNTIDWVNRTFGVTSKDRLLFVTSLSFDLSVYDIFGVLGAGGCLRMTDEQELKDPARLADILRTDHITMWDSAPAALQQLVPFFSRGTPSHDLKLVMLSGDWIPVTLPDQVRSAFPNAKVMALGGATEAAIWSNWFPVDKVDPAWPSIPYGKPIRNARYHVLDKNLQPTPVGVPGELHIGGLCLAEGYLNRPELTAERFIADPFAPGERLYKTGDLARYMPDGNLEFLGRIDHQVKVRGFRVEMGEIETALGQHPAVRDSVVKPFRDDSGNVSLAAYVVRKSPVETSDLAKHLRAGLPDYMVPAAFVYLDVLPLTPNGKVDRAALPVPDAPAAAAAATAYVPPANDAERALQSLWEEVLNTRPVSMTTRFEDLGGHSLLAAQLIARIESRLGHKIPLETLFTAPTIRELASMIQRKLEVGKGSLVPLNVEGNQPPLFLIAGAGGHVFTFHKFARLLGNEFPAYGMKAIGVDGSEPPLDRVEPIAERYIEEILKARPRGPFVLSGYSVGGLMAFEIALLMQKRGIDVARVVLFDTHAPGYPRRLPWPIRMGIHFKNFLTRPGEHKWRYAAERFKNLRHRVLAAMGLGHLDLPVQALVGGLSDQTLKMVWAALERARLRYWPSGQFNGQVVLVRSGEHEKWAATRLNDPLKGWARWTTQPVQVVEVPVGHMEIFSEENMDRLVTQMRDVIRSARKKMSRPGSRGTVLLP